MSSESFEAPAQHKPGPGRPRDPELEARRRAQILEVAARVFAAHGFANTQVQTIANHVGVGNGTVYRYFPTKDQLFLAAVERGLQELTAEMDRVLDQPLEPLDALVEAIRTYLAFFHRRPEMASSSCRSAPPSRITIARCTSPPRTTMRRPASTSRSSSA